MVRGKWANQPEFTLLFEIMIALQYVVLNPKYLTYNFIIFY